MTEATGEPTDDASDAASTPPAGRAAGEPRERGRTIHGEEANAGHRILAPDDAEVEAYLETALHAPGPDRAASDRPATAERSCVPSPARLASSSWGWASAAIGTRSSTN
jgi:hypothetical protein